MQESDDNRKKLLQAEVKIRQLTQATVKDLKKKIKEKDTEIEVLKEMVKSSNIQAKAKETDMQRLQKKVEKFEKGGGLNSRSRDALSAHSRQSHSKHHGGRQPLDDVIPERDEMLEQTGGDYLYQQAQNLNVRGGSIQPSLPKVGKTRQQEWEEAVELDRMLEEERKQQSMQRLAQKSEERHNAYMERI